MANLPKVVRTKELVKHLVWNKHLPTPLEAGEVVLVHSDQTGVEPQYVRIKHGKGKKAVSVFRKYYFIKVLKESLIRD